MRKNEEEHGARLMRYCKAVLLGGGAAFSICMVFLFLASVGISQGLLDGSLRYQLAVVGCVLGSFCGGLLAVRRGPARGLLVGLAAGAVLFLLQLTLALLIYDAVSFENGGLGLLCGALCGGAAAGILGGGKGGSPKSKKRRPR